MKIQVLHWVRRSEEKPPASPKLIIERGSGDSAAQHCAELLEDRLHAWGMDVEVKPATAASAEPQPEEKEVQK